MTEFFMAMIPPTATAQEHKVAVRNGKPIFYDPPDVKAAKEKLTANTRTESTRPASLTQTTCRRCSRTV